MAAPTAGTGAPPGRARRRAAQQPVDYGLLDSGGSDSIYGGDARRFERLLATKAADFLPTESSVDALTGPQLCLDWYRRHGLTRPVFIADRAGLGMSVPGPGFTVRDVADVLGGGWPLDIIDVSSQSEMHGWNLAMWADYFHGAKERKAVLNVISLEFSGTPLARLVRGPRLVRQVDWTDTVWPRRRAAAGQYPQVQYYCLMSVAGSYTDWHVDFSGSSVWYHVHTGEKVFLFAPPDEGVLGAYEAWTTSPTQNSTWFGDLPGVRGKVFQVHLRAGHTMLIPTGWPHAVYTPSDSLVFGGNFMHGAGMQGQLRIAELELFTRVPRKYRLPYAEHLTWYAAGYYLQFARLRDFRPVLRAAMRLTAREAAARSAGAAGGDTAAEAAAPDVGAAVAAARDEALQQQQQKQQLAAARAAISARLFALGLSWHEITGLAALVTTLAHMRGSSLRAQAQAAQQHETTELEAAAGEGNGGAGAAGDDRGGAASAASSASAPRLKLRIGGSSSSAGGSAGSAGGSGGSAGGSGVEGGSSGVHGGSAGGVPRGADALASPAASSHSSESAAGFATRVFAERRVKGQGGVVATGAVTSDSTGDDGVLVPLAALPRADIDVFPPSDAACEAAIMARCPGAPEALLAELAARITVDVAADSADDGAAEAAADAAVEAAWPTPTPPSVLAQHNCVAPPQPPAAAAAAAPPPPPAAPRARLVLKSSTAMAAVPTDGTGAYARPYVPRGTMRHVPVVDAAGGSPTAAAATAAAEGAPATAPPPRVGGGFGLYDGAVPVFLGEGDDVSHAGGGYKYHEKAWDADGDAAAAAAGGGGDGDGEEDEGEGREPRGDAGGGGGGGGEDEEDDGGAYVDDGDDDDDDSGGGGGGGGSKRKRASKRGRGGRRGGGGGDDDSDYDGGGGSDGGSSAEDAAALRAELADLLDDGAPGGRAGAGDGDVLDDGGDLLDVAGPDRYDSRELRAMARAAAVEAEVARLVALGWAPDEAAAAAAASCGGKGSRGPRGAGRATGGSSRRDSKGRLARGKAARKVDADGGAEGTSSSGAGGAAGLTLGEAGGNDGADDGAAPPGKRARLHAPAPAALAGLLGEDTSGKSGGGGGSGRSAYLADGGGASGGALQLTGLANAARSAASRFALGSSTAARVLGGGGVGGARPSVAVLGGFKSGGAAGDGEYADGGFDGSIGSLVDARGGVSSGGGGGGTANAARGASASHGGGGSGGGGHILSLLGGGAGRSTAGLMSAAPVPVGGLAALRAHAQPPPAAPVIRLRVPAAPPAAGAAGAGAPPASGAAGAGAPPAAAEGGTDGVGHAGGLGLGLGLGALLGLGSGLGGDGSAAAAAAPTGYVGGALAGVSGLFGGFSGGPAPPAGNAVAGGGAPRFVPAIAGGGGGGGGGGPRLAPASLPLPASLFAGTGVAGLGLAAAPTPLTPWAPPSATVTPASAASGLTGASALQQRIKELKARQRGAGGAGRR